MSSLLPSKLRVSLLIACELQKHGDAQSERRRPTREGWREREREGGGKVEESGVWGACLIRAESHIKYKSVFGLRFSPKRFLVSAATSCYLPTFVVVAVF